MMNRMGCLHSIKCHSLGSNSTLFTGIDAGIGIGDDNPTQLYGDYFINQYKDPEITQPVFHGSRIRPDFYCRGSN